MDTVHFDYDKLNKNDKLVYDRMNESEKLQFERLWESIEQQKVKMQQQINKSKTRYQREKTVLAKKERAERTHRLIERGAILEQFVPVEFTNDEIVSLLKNCVASEYGQRCIQAIRQRRINNSQ